MLTDVPGVRVGHWTHGEARTGCTVVLFPAGTVASGEVRGGAPATREFDLLDPHRLVARLDAVLLTGGSAFGLAAADGVMRFCEERGMGVPTVSGPVPIVVAMALYDLGVGDPAVRPGPDEGYAACVAARVGEVALGPVGAGAGATFDKWRGREHARPAGLGARTMRHAGVTVSALVAVNAFGAPDDGTFHWVSGVDAPAFGNTTLAVVVTDAKLDKVGCLLAAGGGHDGLARALLPAHARVDGDAVVAAATGAVAADPDLVRLLCTLAVEGAVRDAVAGRGPGGHR